MSKITINNIVIESENFEKQAILLYELLLEMGAVLHFDIENDNKKCCCKGECCGK